MKIRIIPRLEVKGPNLVKGIQLDGLRVLGDPYDYAVQYYQEGADEIIYIDIVASLYGRSILPEIVKSTAREIFIPLTVGGGIRTLKDIETLLSAGADKVAINTAAIANPSLIEEAAKAFGSQCIILSIEAKKNGNYYEPYVENGRQPTGKNVLDWAKQGVELGAGEILLTSVDQEGTQLGFDKDLSSLLRDKVSVPVIVAGGAGTKKHVLDVLESSQPDGVCCSSLLHYFYLEKILSNSSLSKERVDFIRHQAANYKLAQSIAEFSPLSIGALKGYLEENGFFIRR